MKCQEQVVFYSGGSRHSGGGEGGGGGRSQKNLFSSINRGKGGRGRGGPLPWARLHKTPVTVTGIRTCTGNLSELH